MAKPPISTLLRAPAGPIDLHGVDTRATPGFKQGKAAAKEAIGEMTEQVSTLQEQLYAEGRTGGRRSVLLVLQGMDTSGKGGTVRHVVGQMDPGGMHVAAFKAPSAEERRHDFLWRIRRELPGPGVLGVFDRSHYEDVVTVGVLGLADKRTVTRRYGSIERFEADLVDGGTRLVKCFLHISADEQRERLLARLDDPTKHWKFNPADLDMRTRWDDFQVAYGDAIGRTSTDLAPWHVVPADRKWYRNWAISRLMIEQLEALSLDWPKPDYDSAEQRERLLGMP